MAQTRVQFAQIGGLQPLVDYRKSGTIGVIQGRNFAWDASGVKSSFASRLIATDEELSPDGRLVHEIEIGEFYHVAVEDKVFKLTQSEPGSATGTWITVATLDEVQQANPSNVPEFYRGFTFANMAEKSYVCSWNNGVYEVEPSTDAYTRLKQADVSGFPADIEPVIAIAETNGRLLYMTKTTIYWSAPNDPTNLVPTVGGAGFQTIGEQIGGDPRALTPIPTGAIVWTTSGALVVEFIGGDLSFRFYELSSDTLPLSQSATVRLPTNSYLILTRLGLFSVVLAQTPEVVTPLFNEFLREYMRTRKLEVAYLWYTQADNRVFLSFRGDTGTFIETFCLDIGLDRWGVFNESHLGMFHYTDQRSPFGFANSQGVGSYFLPSRDPRKNKELSAAPGTFEGLGSNVTIGFVRAEQLASIADGMQELNEVVVYRKLPLEGFTDTFFDEGSAPAPMGTPVFDEGLATAGSFDMFDEGTLATALPTDAYQLEILSDIFSADEGFSGNLLQRPMVRINSGALADTWTGALVSYYFRLKFIAEQDGEFFRINAIDCTLTGAGQLV